MNGGFFDGIDGVDPSGSSPRFPEGTFVVRVYECRVNQGQWGTRFIVECDVIQSDNPQVAEGSRRSWTVQIDGAYRNVGLAEVKAFAAAASGIEPSDKERVNATITSGVINAAVTTAQPLKGRVVRTQVIQKTTRNNHPIAKHVWLPMDTADAAALGVQAIHGVPQAVAAPQQPPAPQGFPQQPPQGFAPPAFPQQGFPPAPPAPPAPVAAPPFPPPGWTAHPSAGWYYRGQEVLSEQQLRERQQRGTA